MKINNKKIQKELERLGISQDAFATQIGMSKQLLSFHLVGRGGKTLKIIERIAKGLGIEPMDLIK